MMSKALDRLLVDCVLTPKTKESGVGEREELATGAMVISGWELL